MNFQEKKDSLDVNGFDCFGCPYFKAWEEHHPGGKEYLCECRATDGQDCPRLMDYSECCTCHSCVPSDLILMHEDKLLCVSCYSDLCDRMHEQAKEGE